LQFFIFSWIHMLVLYSYLNCTQWFIIFHQYVQNNTIIQHEWTHAWSAVECVCVFGGWFKHHTWFTLWCIAWSMPTSHYHTRSGSANMLAGTICSVIHLIVHTSNLYNKHGYSPSCLCPLQEPQKSHDRRHWAATLLNRLYCRHCFAPIIKETKSKVCQDQWQKRKGKPWPGENTPTGNQLQGRTLWVCGTHHWSPPRHPRLLPRSNRRYLQQSNDLLPGSGKACARCGASYNFPRTHRVANNSAASEKHSHKCRLY